MSGFVGLYSLHRALPCNHALLERMTVALRERGNHTGSWSNGQIGLAMAGWGTHTADPVNIPYHATNMILAADARLDYRQELIARLESAGALLPQKDTFLSDLVLVATSYTCYGEKCTSYLDGDYAFLLWDACKRRLFGARSMTGMRPFVYTQSPQYLSCASDAKLLLNDTQVSTAFNAEWMTTWLMTGHECANTTPYTTIQKLPAGHCLIADDDGIRIHAFWTPTTRKQKQHAGQQEYSEEFRRLLFASVHSRLSSPHPCLSDISGGLDSSSIACIAGSLHRQNKLIPPLYSVHAYSEHFPENNDRDLASLVAEVAGIPRTYYLSYDDLKPFADIFRPRPWCDTPTPPTLFFAKLYERIFQICQEHGIRGYLRGDFGDQLFDPSPRYLHTLAQEQRYAMLLREIWFWQQSGTVALHDVLGNVLGSQHRRELERQSREKSPWLQVRVFEDYARRSQQENETLHSIVKSPLARVLYQNMLWHDEYVSMQNDGFVASGIETMEPYMDKRLIEFLLSCPAQYQMRFGIRKYLLREAMRDILPEPVRLRRSKGRIARVLMAGIAEQKNVLLSLIESMPAELEPYLDATRLAHVLSHVAYGGSVDQTTFFSALSLVLWAHRLPWCRGQRLQGDLS